MDNNMLEGLEKLKAQVLRELVGYSAAGKLTTQTYHEVKDLTECAKNMCKLIWMLKENESEMDGSSRGMMPMSEGWYAVSNGMRGNGQRSYGYDGMGYSGHDSGFARELYRMADQAPTPQMRQTLMNFAMETEGRR